MQESTFPRCGRNTSRSLGKTSKTSKGKPTTPTKLASALTMTMQRRRHAGIWSKDNPPPRKPKGQKSHRTREVKALAERLVTDPVYLKNLEKRLKAGRAPHMEITLFHYAFGKPRDIVKLEGSVAIEESQAVAEFKAQLRGLSSKVVDAILARRQQANVIDIPPLSLNGGQGHEP